MDNGSNWNLYSLVNAVYFFKVFKDSNLDVLGKFSMVTRMYPINSLIYLKLKPRKKKQRYLSNRPPVKSFIDCFLFPMIAFIHVYTCKVDSEIFAKLLFFTIGYSFSQ